MNSMKEKILAKVVSFKDNPSLKTWLFIIIMLVMSFIIVTQSITIIQLNYKISSLNDVMVDYQNNDKVLSEKVDQLNTDSYIEEQATTRLGMVKPGDMPIKVVEKPQEQTQAKPIPSQEKVGIYMQDWYGKLQEWVNYLQNK